MKATWKNVKVRLAETTVQKPKYNLSRKEHIAVKELKQNTDKGSTTVILNITDKLQEGLIQLINRDHYLPLEKPMVAETLQKSKEIISQLHNDKYTAEYIDDMTKQWLSQTPNPPRIPIFYTLKSTNQNRSEDRLSQVVMDQPKEYHHLWIIYCSLLPCDKNRISKTQLIS